MDRRSWMTQVTHGLVVGGAWLSSPHRDLRAADGELEPGSVINTIHLELRISGLGTNGCDIEVKPGHAACSFRPVVLRLKPGEERSVLKLPPIVASSISADRDCSFAITVKEPGVPTMVLRRGIRLTASNANEADPSDTAKPPLPVQVLTYYLVAPSLAAREDATRKK